MNVTTTVNLDAAQPTATLYLSGDLDYTTTNSVVAAARRLIAEHPTVKALHLDCAELTFCDSAGLAGLLDIHEQTQLCGVELCLDHRPVQLDRLLDITGVFDHLIAPAAAEPEVAADEAEETELG